MISKKVLSRFTSVPWNILNNELYIHTTAVQHPYKSLSTTGYFACCLRSNYTLNNACFHNITSQDYDTWPSHVTCTYWMATCTPQNEAMFRTNLSIMNSCCVMFTSTSSGHTKETKECKNSVTRVGMATWSIYNDNPNNAQPMQVNSGFSRML